MKTICSILVMLAVSHGIVVGQEKSVDLDQKAIAQASQQRMQEAVEKQSALLNRLFGVNVQTSGVVPMALKSTHPWQLINPWAPPEYGNGFDNTTEDPRTGRPKGISIFGIRF